MGSRDSNSGPPVDEYITSRAGRLGRARRPGGPREGRRPSPELRWRSKGASNGCGPAPVMRDGRARAPASARSAASSRRSRRRRRPLRGHPGAVSCAYLPRDRPQQSPAGAPGRGDDADLAGQVEVDRDRDPGCAGEPVDECRRPCVKKGVGTGNGVLGCARSGLVGGASGADADGQEVCVPAAALPDARRVADHVEQSRRGRVASACPRRRSRPRPAVARRTGGRDSSDTLPVHRAGRGGSRHEVERCGGTDRGHHDDGFHDEAEPRINSIIDIDTAAPAGGSVLCSPDVARWVESAGGCGHLDGAGLPARPHRACGRRTSRVVIGSPPRRKAPPACQAPVGPVTSCSGRATAYRGAAAYRVARRGPSGPWTSPVRSRLAGAPSLWRCGWPPRVSGRRVCGTPLRPGS